MVFIYLFVAHTHRNRKREREREKKRERERGVCSFECVCDIKKEIQIEVDREKDR